MSCVPTAASATGAGFPFASKPVAGTDSVDSMTDSTFDPTDLRWLAHLARRLVSEPHAADDLVQDTLLASLQGGVPGAAPRRAWLAGIARRLAARQHRGAVRRARREHHAARDEALPAADDLAARAEAAEWVAAATRSLPEPWRRTILLRFLEGLTSAEIAARDGCPVDTVRQRVRRGLGLLRAELGRRTGKDWSSLSTALLPLAASWREPVTAAGTVSAAGFGVGLSGLMVAMNAKLWWGLMLLVAAAGGGVWWALGDGAGPVRPGGEATSPNDSAARVGDPASGSTRREGRVADPSTSDPARRQVAADAGSAPRTLRSDDLLGVVVDPSGEAVAGARIALLDPEAGADASARARTIADEQGRFRLAAAAFGEAPGDLGVFANGYLRRFLVGVRPGGEPLRVELDVGEVLGGRVVDAHGRPVPDLELLVTAPGAPVGHVSPTQVGLRAEQRVFAERAAEGCQCRARTDELGRVRFAGLAGASIAVRSLSPDWQVLDPVEVELRSAREVLWTAARRLGVRVRCVDAEGRPVDDVVRATFRVWLTFADGSREDFGQWVGRGSGGVVSFGLDRAEWQVRPTATVVRAEFYGTVGTEDAAAEWRAEPLIDSTGVAGLATARAVLQPREPVVENAPGAAPAERPMAKLACELRRADGLPFEAPFQVRWRLVDDGQVVAQGDAESADLARAGGLPLVDVPAGTLQLEVQERFASGSLPPWRGEVFAVAARVTPFVAVLPTGAVAVIERPSDWEGAWSVRARWQPAGGEVDEDAWQGAWSYGTSDASLTLRALRPAYWRFALRPAIEPERTESEVRVVELGVGETVRVGPESAATLRKR